jgi:hypothetical protein
MAESEINNPFVKRDGIAGRNWEFDTDGKCRKVVGLSVIYIKKFTN